MAITESQVKLVSGFTEEEEKRIQDEVDAYVQREREARIQHEIQNRIRELSLKKPGQRYS